MITSGGDEITTVSGMIVERTIQQPSGTMEAGPLPVGMDLQGEYEVAQEQCRHVEEQIKANVDINPPN